MRLSRSAMYLANRASGSKSILPATVATSGLRFIAGVPSGSFLLASGIEAGQEPNTLPGMSVTRTDVSRPHRSPGSILPLDAARAPQDQAGGGMREGG